VLARYIASTSHTLLQEGATDRLRALTRDLVATGGDQVRYVEIVGPGEQVVAAAGAYEALSRAPALRRRLDDARREIVRELGEADRLWVHLFGHTFDIAVPLGRADESAGWIRLGISTAQANRKMREVTLVNLGIALAAIVASILVAWLVDRRIRASLSDLMEVTRQMARGDLSLRAEIRTGDELQGLGDSFNLMADQLARHRAELEERVEARTRELAETSDTLRRIQTDQIRYERL
jgi:methyl-accepting chemotaxis protein